MEMLIMSPTSQKGLLSNRYCRLLDQKSTADVDVTQHKNLCCIDFLGEGVWFMSRLQRRITNWDIEMHACQTHRSPPLGALFGWRNVEGSAVCPADL